MDLLNCVCFFFFKQKTAYEMRISDWSSDVCSSDLGPEGVNLAPHYDMLSTACYESRAYEKDAWPSASTLAWPILDAERFSDLSFDLLVQAGMKMGLTQKRARDQIGRAHV